MTVVDMLALYRGWRKAPPTHRLAAAWLGFKGPAEAEPTEVDNGSFQAALAATGDMFKAPRRWFKG